MAHIKQIEGISIGKAEVGGGNEVTIEFNRTMPNSDYGVIIDAREGEDGLPVQVLAPPSERNPSEITIFKAEGEFEDAYITVIAI